MLWLKGCPGLAIEACAARWECPTSMPSRSVELCSCTQLMSCLCMACGHSGVNRWGKDRVGMPYIATTTPLGMFDL